MIKFVEIKNIEYIKGNKDIQLNDLTVEHDHSYIVNNICVHNCTTSANSSVHMPLASLLSACYELKCKHDFSCKIIADGGINSYNRAITALALGADYVMIGTAFASAFESSASFIFGDQASINSDFGVFSVMDNNHYMFSNTIENVPQHKCYLQPDGKVLMINRGDESQTRVITPNEEMKKMLIKDFETFEVNPKYQVRKEIFGMSTRKAQSLINEAGTKKTSEGISRLVPVKYTVAQWADNFKSYLRSAMSYCDKTTLESFIGEVETRIMSPIAQNSFNK